jgi:hypothetical protein
MRIGKIFETLGAIPGPLGGPQFLQLFPKYHTFTFFPTCHGGYCPPSTEITSVFARRRIGKMIETFGMISAPLGGPQFLQLFPKYPMFPFFFTFHEV